MVNGSVVQPICFILCDSHRSLVYGASIGYSTILVVPPIISIVWLYFNLLIYTPSNNVLDGVHYGLHMMNKTIYASAVVITDHVSVDGVW